jgi:two-component system phosphate regulon response regulator OmpR
MQTRVLAVDDDPDMRSLLSGYLSEQQFDVQAVASPAEAERLLQRRPFDVMLLDLALGRASGLDFCRDLRAAGETLPIIMLTARGEPTDRIVGLRIGADDYLPKPFEPLELVARIDAHVRRQRMAAACAISLPDGEWRIGECTVNFAQRTLHRDGVALAASSTTWTLLSILAAHPNRPLSRRRLIELSKGRDAELQERTIDVQVMRLRRLIESDPSKPRCLVTAWGRGYTLQLAVLVPP